MNEKIGEEIENNEAKIETKDNKDIISSGEVKEECDISKGREIFQKIQAQSTVKNSDDKNSVSLDEKKEVDNLVKESRFGVGIQKVIGGIKKMKVFIGKKMYLLDEVHDRSKTDTKK